jgi:hypothetical protein
MSTVLHHTNSEYSCTIYITAILPLPCPLYPAAQRLRVPGRAGERGTLLRVPGRAGERDLPFILPSTRLQGICPSFRFECAGRPEQAHRQPPGAGAGAGPPPSCDRLELIALNFPPKLCMNVIIVFGAKGVWSWGVSEWMSRMFMIKFCSIPCFLLARTWPRKTLGMGRATPLSSFSRPHDCKLMKPGTSARENTCNEDFFGDLS